MRHRSTVKVRFSDTDMYGHVNNAVYMSYMEEARVQFFLEGLEVGRIPLILASAKVNFKAQTYFPDTLTVESYVTRIGNSSFDIRCHIYDSSSKEVFEGTCVLVHFVYEKQKSEPIPATLREKLQAFLEP